MDEVAPGAPTFVSVQQTGNKQWAASVQLPLVDADGSELTGLSKLTVASTVMVNGENPFIGKSMDEIIASGAQVQHVDLTPGDAGTIKDVTIPLVNLGGFQAFAAAVTD